MIRPVLAVLVALVLSGCGFTPEGQAFKFAIPVVADKVVDGAYRVTCGLPYKTEQRFLARNDIDKISFKMYCKRSIP